MRHSELDDFLAKVLELYLSKQRKANVVRDAILERFECDPAGVVKRIAVHTVVSERLGRPINNAMVASIHAALATIQGVTLIVRDGDRVYTGLKAKA